VDEATGFEAGNNYRDTPGGRQSRLWREPRHVRQPARSRGACRSGLESEQDSRRTGNAETGPARASAEEVPHHDRFAHDQPIAKNALDRKFEAAQPNRVWSTDITYVWTREGWLYLAIIIDLFSRRVVGWATANHMRTSLVLNALRMAVGRRLPHAGLVHHSDRGTQYASKTYRDALAELDIVCSMSRKGSCWDNAVSESFFSTIKHELIHRHDWETRAAASLAIAEYIECFYNTRRRHSYLGFTSPVEYERIYASPPIAA
jgi:putative transposase